MNKLSVLSHRGLPAKLFLINLLVCVTFIIISLTVFLSFRHIKNELTDTFMEKLGQITENAQLGRELTRVIADTNFLINTFYGKEEFLKTEGEHLVRKTDALITKSGEAGLKEILMKFATEIRELLRLCAVVNEIRQQIRGYTGRLDSISLKLGEVVSGRLADAVMENWETSALDALPLIISEYRASLVLINLRFTELGLEHFEQPVQKNAHPIFSLLDELQLKTRPLAAYDPVIAAYGKRLGKNILKCRESLTQFHKAARSLHVKRNETDEKKETLLTLMGETDTRIVGGVEQDVALLKKQIVGGAAFGGLIVFIIILIVLALTFLLGRSIVKSMNMAVLRFRDFAEGQVDLTIRLEIKSQDELGEMARWFNIFVENLRCIIREITENAGTLNMFAAEMSSISGLMSQGANEVSERSDSVASSAEEMSININTIASSAEEISVNVQSISTTAKQMSRNMNSVTTAIGNMSTAVNKISENAREGAEISTTAIDMAQTATHTMNTLGQAVRQIGEVIEIIRKIAEKTNLLALNARIEAASAGDAGRGFAVVANEIKELANQSAQAARDVAERIEGVQRNTSDAVEVIDDVSDIINNINDSVGSISMLAEQQSQSASDISYNVYEVNMGVGNIAASIGEIVRGVNEMSMNAGEAAKGTNEVAANIQSVSQAASDSSAGARQVNSSAAELAKVSEQMKELVGKFKV